METAFQGFRLGARGAACPAARAGDLHGSSSTLLGIGHFPGNYIPQIPGAGKIRDQVKAVFRLMVTAKNNGDLMGHAGLRDTAIREPMRPQIDGAELGPRAMKLSVRTK